MLTSRKLFLAASVAALSVSVVSAPIYTEAATKSFKDVPTSHVYYKEITEMASKGIIHGYENGTFKPNELITRKHAAALLARAFPSTEKYSKDFKDMTKANAYHADMSLAIEMRWLEAKNGNVRPDDTITRGEMAIALYRAYELGKLGYSNSVVEFKDVGQLDKVTSVLYDAGITTGYEDNTFRPSQGLSRAHYSVFMYRASEALNSKKDVIDQIEKDKLGWDTTPAPKLPSQAAMDKSDKDNILLAGRESNTGKYGEVIKVPREVYSEKHIKISLGNKGYSVGQIKELLKRVDSGEFIKDTTPNGTSLWAYYHYSEGRYHIGL